MVVEVSVNDVGKGGMVPREAQGITSRCYTIRIQPWTLRQDNKWINTETRH